MIEARASAWAKLKAHLAANDVRLPTSAELAESIRMVRPPFPAPVIIGFDLGMSDCSVEATWVNLPDGRIIFVEARVLERSKEGIPLVDHHKTAEK